MVSFSLLWAGLLIALTRRPRESLHGDARFASISDLRKAGLLKQTPQSVLIGNYRGNYLWLGGAQHVITISPTRSGKTTSIAIPVLLSYQNSMVVLDLKGELFKATSGWRQAQGHAIRVWAPYDEAGQTLLSLGTNSKDVKGKMKNTKEGIQSLGEALAKQAASAKISKVVFDRAGYLYHGKVKAFAEGARAGGLKF